MFILTTLAMHAEGVSWDELGILIIILIVIYGDSLIMARPKRSKSHDH